MFEAMVVPSPSRVRRRRPAHPFGDFTLDPEMLARAASTAATSELLVIGEPHGVRETPSVLYALAAALGTRAIALEWSHEEMEERCKTSSAAVPSTSSASGRFPLRLSSSAVTVASPPGTSRCSSGSATRGVSIR